MEDCLGSVSSWFLVILYMAVSRKKHWHCPSLEALSSIAEELLVFAGPVRVWLLDAEMGTGKTTLTTQVCRALGVEDATSSPTFALVNEYHTPTHEPIYHFDCYRLDSAQEALELGFEEYLYSGNYCFIEWPFNITDLLPATNYALVTILLESDHTRTINMMCYE